MSEIKKTILTLIQHNDWRRGVNDSPTEPNELSVAMCHAITLLMDVENLLKQRGRHNTEIAYRRLEISAIGE